MDQKAVLMIATIGTFLFSTTIGRAVLFAAGGLIGLWAYGIYKERSGYNACKVEWSAAEQAAISKARDARADGERDVANDDPSLHQDRYNRDNH